MSQAVINQARAAEAAGNLAAAIALYEAAVAASGAPVDVLTRLGALYAMTKRTRDSLRAFETVVRQRPDSAGAQYNVGRARLTAGDAEGAFRAVDAATRIAPTSAASFLAWGSALDAVGRSAEAVTVYARAQAAGCADGALALGHGLALARCGKPEEALAKFDVALQQRPALAADVEFNRGTCLATLGQHAPALAAFDAALASRPGYAEALTNRALSRLALGDPRGGLTDVDAVLAVQARLGPARRVAGRCCLVLGRLADAADHFRVALEVHGGDVESWEGLGDAYQTMRAYDPAVAAYRECLVQLAATESPRDDRTRVLNKQLESLLGDRDLGGAREAVLALRRLDPGFPCAAGFELHLALWLGDWGEIEPLRSDIVAATRRGEPQSVPFPLLSAIDDPEAHLACARTHIQRCFAPVSGPLERRRGYGHHRLRVGYVSPDFREHPVGLLIAATLEAHDRERFEVIGISTLVSAESTPTGDRIRHACDRFLDASLMDDADVARWVRDEEVDLLVDLAGHTSHGRPGIFAFHAAPVQVNYLGYPGTYGADHIDYIMSDPHTTPAELEACFAERIARLPGSLVPPGDQRREPGRLPSRPELGLPADAIVLCAFHGTYKILPEVYAIWMRLLAAQPRAVLWISAPTEGAGPRFLSAASRAGIDPGRIHFAGRVAGQDEHLARLFAADLLLDAFPYNAHSSAGDALWAGVPVITCSGRSFASRVCGGLLHAVGLPGLVTDSLEDYERLARELVTEPSRLAALRSGLRQRILSTDAMNSEVYTRNLEWAYEAMMARAERGDLPASFDARRAP